MRRALFVPDDFDPPTRLVTTAFVLEALGPQHNERDYAAWTSSIEHILATPGIFQPGAEHPWPYPMAPEENLRDLVRHAEDFAARRGFTYTVLDPAGKDVIGCVHLPVEGRCTRCAREVLGHRHARRPGPSAVAGGVGLDRRRLAVPEPGLRGARLTPPLEKDRGGAQARSLQPITTGPGPPLRQPARGDRAWPAWRLADLPPQAHLARRSQDRPLDPGPRPPSARHP